MDRAHDHSAAPMRTTIRQGSRLCAVLIAMMLPLITGTGLADARPQIPLPFSVTDYSVLTDDPGGPDFKIFYSAGSLAGVFDPILPGTSESGAENQIRDRDGRIVWRYRAPTGKGLANFRTQTYRGDRVMTWWEGTNQIGRGSGEAVIATMDGSIITRLTAGPDLPADAHEFRLTSNGYALITAYREISADLSSIGGSTDATMLDSVASVIDVATGKVVQQWSAYAHVPLTEATDGGTTRAANLGPLFDPYHINSIAMGPNGDLLISLRGTNTVYSVDLESGRIRWRLGGISSDFTLGAGADFAGQHDAEYVDDTTIRLFDNAVDGTSIDGASQGKWIRIDPRAGSARLVRSVGAGQNLSTLAMGNVSAVAGGYSFVGWGSASRVSLFSPRGRLIYDAKLGVPTYRAYFEQWP